MSAIDWDRLAIAPTMAVFGDPVTYTPLGASAPLTGITGIFDDGYKDVSFDKGVPESTVRPVLGVQFSQFPPGGPKPQQGDRVVIAGTAYVVRDVNPDGLGGARLDLQLAAS